jgi:hypothetical protein
MNLSDAPSKIILPFANNGGKNSIPVASQIPITPGAASWYDGFPPLTRTAKVAGGVPPFGLDMNGVMFSISALSRWANAGAGFVYDNTFAIHADIAGYPKGARILRTDGTGYWLNTIDGNEVDPESASTGAAVAAGWVPDFTNGITSVTMTNANVTLTPAQYGKPVIVITGLLTGNLNLIFPAIQGKWYVINNTTGAFTITCKTNAGTGFVVSTLGELIGDGTNIYNANKDSALLTVANVFTQIQSAVTPAQFDNTTKLATTAFVQAAGLKFSTVLYPTSNTALSSTAVGSLVFSNSASAIALTLPVLSGVLDGQEITFYNYAAGNCTVSPAAFPDLLYVAGSGSISSIVLRQGDSLTVAKGNATDWLVIGGSASLPYVNPPLVNELNGTVTLTSKNIGQLIFANGVLNATLPAANSFVDGSVISFLTQNTSNIITLLAAGSDVIVSTIGTTTNLVLSNTYLTLKSFGSSGKWLVVNGLAPQNSTVTKFTSGSGTYTTPSGCKQLRIKMNGGGGGGAGGGTTPGSGGAGGTTTFNSINANGAGGGSFSSGAAGGSGGTGTASLRAAGNGGVNGATVTTGTTGGGSGGGSVFAGGGASPGIAGATNTGGGGGGGAATGGAAPSGGGGGGGEYAEILINFPAASYSYAVGAAGTAGTAGTNGSAGSAGGSGVIYIAEYY